jgi:hypothetical protein
VFTKNWSTNAEDLLSLPDQSQQSKTFVKDDTLDKETGGKTEGVQKFMQDRRWGGPKAVNLTVITVIGRYRQWLAARAYNNYNQR